MKFDTQCYEVYDEKKEKFSKLETLPIRKTIINYILCLQMQLRQDHLSFSKWNSLDSPESIEFVENYF